MLKRTLLKNIVPWKPLNKKIKEPTRASKKKKKKKKVSPRFL